MPHALSGAEKPDNTNGRKTTAAGVCRWPLLYGLIIVLAVLAFGPFPVTAIAHAQTTTTIHAQGTFASARFLRFDSATTTFMYILVSRDAQEQKGSGNITVTTHVTYFVCVQTNSTLAEVCQDGDGAIANDELSGDVHYGLGGPPKALTLDFNSGTESSFQLSATECEPVGVNCSNTTPIGGVIDLTWTRNNLVSVTTTGISEERDYGKVGVRSAGRSTYISAYASGSMLGLVGVPFTGFPSNEIGTVRNFTFDVYFQPK